MDTRFPEPFETYVEVLDSVNFDIVAPFKCSDSTTNYLTDLVLATIPPIVLSGVLLGLHWRSTSNSSASSEETGKSPFFSYFLILTYLVLPNAAIKICAAFKLDEFEIDDSGSVQTLVAVDYSIEVGGSNYYALRTYASIMFFIYICGIPTLYMVLLYQAQNELSIFQDISVKELLCGPTMQAEFAKLKAFYASDIAAGKGPDGKVVSMLNEIYQDNFEVVDDVLPHDRLKQLEQYYEAKVRGTNTRNKCKRWPMYN